MPFARPPLSELRAGVAADLTSSIAGGDALLRTSNLRVLGAIMAAAAHGHYGYIDWIAKNAVPFTCTGEYLEAWAALKGVTRKPATAAGGQGTFVAAAGAVLPAGTQVLRGDGVAYAVAADTPAAGGQVVPSLVAVTPGAAANLASGAALTLGSAIAGVAAAGTASSDFTGGADLEDDDGLRSRMLIAFASPPQGGDASDYVDWALAVPGVTRAWCAPREMGAGTVTVRFMMDTAEAGQGGFPQGTDGVAAAETRALPATGDQLAVANAIYVERPVTALVYAVAPQPNTVAFTIAGLATASAATQTAVKAAIAQVFLTQGAPGGVVDVSYIEAAIAAVAATKGFVITAIACDHGQVTPGAAGNIASNIGKLPVLGVVTWA